MLWANQWRRFSQWFERWPLWAQVAVFPLVAPAVFAVAAVCVAPRTSAVAGLVLVVVYGLLFRQGIIGREEVGRYAGWLYLVFIAVSYVGMLGGVSERALDWLFDRRPARPGQGSPTTSAAEER